MKNTKLKYFYFQFQLRPRDLGRQAGSSQFPRQHLPDEAGQLQPGDGGKVEWSDLASGELNRGGDAAECDQAPGHPQ